MFLSSRKKKKTGLLKWINKWIIYIVGYLGQILKHTTVLSLTSTLLLLKLSSLLGIYKKYEPNLRYNLNPVRDYSWTAFPQPEVSRWGLILLTSHEKWGDLLNWWVLEKEQRCAFLVLNPLFEKMYVWTALWSWVCSRQPAPAMGVKLLLPPLRPAWGSVWLEMKCSEACCDCTSKGHPPNSWSFCLLD